MHVPKAYKYTMIEKSCGNETEDGTEGQAGGKNGSTQKVASPEYAQ